MSSPVGATSSSQTTEISESVRVTEKNDEPVAGIGQPANVLLQASEGASLLAVGPRGLGGFKGLMLGSVSDYVVSQAPCPVVVVRDDQDPTLSEPADKI